MEKFFCLAEFSEERRDEVLFVHERTSAKKFLGTVKNSGGVVKFFLDSEEALT